MVKVGQFLSARLDVLPELDDVQLRTLEEGAAGVRDALYVMSLAVA